MEYGRKGMVRNTRHQQREGDPVRVADNVYQRVQSRKSSGGMGYSELVFSRRPHSVFRS